MGLDLRIMAAKSKRELNDLQWEDWTEWNDIKDKYDNDFSMIPKPCEVWYARKFYELMSAMSFLHNYDCGEYIRLHKDNLREMINFYCYHPDYFYGFNGLPRLCELYQEFDEMEDAGINLYFEADW